MHTKPMFVKLGAILAERRKALELTQTQLGKYIGVKQPTIMNVELGRAFIGRCDTVELIMRGLETFENDAALLARHKASFAIDEDKIEGVEYKQRTPRETAILVSTMLKRSGNSRILISEQTFCLLSNSKVLPDPDYVKKVWLHTQDFGVWFLTLPSGNFAAIYGKAIEGAKAATVKNCGMIDFMLHLNANKERAAEMLAKVEMDLKTPEE